MVLCAFKWLLLDFADSLHTTGVGTFVYAAPEQLKGSRYDSKVNIIQVIQSLLYDYSFYSLSVTLK